MHGGESEPRSDIRDRFGYWLSSLPEKTAQSFVSAHLLVPIIVSSNCLCFARKLFYRHGPTLHLQVHGNSYDEHNSQFNRCSSVILDLFKWVLDASKSRVQKQLGLWNSELMEMETDEFMWDWTVVKGTQGGLNPEGVFREHSNDVQRWRDRVSFS